MKQKILETYTALKDSRTPWMARLLLLLLLAYILSPIDLIPDFIPVLGLLDEAILIPIVLAVVHRLIPDNVRQDARLKCIEATDERRLLLIGAGLVIVIWLILLLLGWVLFEAWNN